MPLKAGPNGTMRHYSSSTGQYINEFDWLLLNNPSLSKSEKRKLKKARLKEFLDEKAKKSNDPLLNDVYKFIQRQLPNSVMFINEMIYNPETKKHQELDIITKTGIIEIKSSQNPHCLTQALVQKQYADKRKIKYILYAPNINIRALKEYESHGVKIATKLCEIEEELKK